MKNRVLAFHGPKGSGKDTAIDIIIDAFPELNIKRVAFADPIKQEVINMFQLDGERDYDGFKRSTLGHLAGRELVRYVGMLMRSYDEDQFIEYVSEQIASDKDAIWLISDLRFQNEVDWLNKHGCSYIEIKRGELDGHPSELPLENFWPAAIISNNTSLNDFRKEVIRQFIFWRVL